MTHLPPDGTRDDSGGDDERTLPFTPSEARRLGEWVDATGDSSESPLASDLSIEQDMRRCLEALKASQAIESLGVSSVLRRRPSDEMPSLRRPVTRVVEVAESQSRFENPRLVGDGGYGVVFFVEDRSLGIEVAIKLLRPSRTSLESKYRFFEEAKTMARLSHPGIVRIFDTGTIDGIPFITSSKANGGSLDDLIAAHPEGLDPTRAAEIMAQVADAVESAHRQGILHRDIKPANILIQHGEGELRERTLLTDFGLAKRSDPQENIPGITEPGDQPGTRRYMSPEQIQGEAERVGAASEVFSLGVVLYQLLTGRLPFDAELPRQLRDQIVGLQPLRPSQLHERVSRDLDAIVFRAMEKQPERRYGMPRGLADDLRRFLNHEPVEASNPSWLRQLASAARRHPWLTSGIATVIGSLLFATIGIGLAWQRQRVATQREEEAKSAWIALCGRMVDEVAAGEKRQESVVLDALEEGIRSLERELEIVPDDERTLHRLSVMLHYASVTRRRLGDVEASLSDRLRSCGVLERLIAEHPSHVKYRYQFVLGCLELSENEAWLIERDRLRHSPDRSTREFVLSANFIAQMEEHLDRILGDDGDDVDFRDGAIHIRIGLADRVRPFDAPRAEAMVDQGVRESIALAERHPDRPALVKPALLGLTKIALWLGSTGRNSEALERLSQAERVFAERLRPIDTFVWVRMEELTLLREKIDLLIAIGEYGAAREACERGELLVDQLEPAPAQRIAAAVARFRLTTRRYAIARATGDDAEVPTLEARLIDLARASTDDPTIRTAMNASVGPGPLPEEVRSLLGSQ